MLSENQLEELIKQLETMANTATELVEEPNHREFFEQAIWAVENIDETVKGQLESNSVFLPSEERIETIKINILNSICDQVSTAWETINDGSELEDLGEQALNLACEALSKLNAIH